MSTVLKPGAAQPASSRLSAREQLSRAQAVSQGACTLPACVADVHVGMFFDGTNNNKKRDQEDVQDPNARSHSNVVVLFDAYNDQRPKHYRYYVPGVGTPFPDIGEMGESREGKSMARGGEARIHWAMIQVLNAAHRALSGQPLVDKARLASLVNGPSFLGGGNLVSTSDARRRGVFSTLISELAAKLRDNKPRLQTLYLTVFGFSRGAAEARVFCHWLDRLWKTVVEADDRLYGCIPRLRIQFVGLFDTVASVGLANSAPVPNDGGFMSWADGTLELPARVDRCVHYVAMHEIRKSFPLSTTRKSLCAVREVMYPGAHSDVGGGYAPGDQGKARSRADLLSQVPLLHMFREARAAGVPLADAKELDSIGRAETINDLALSQELAQRFDEYLQYGPKGGEINKTVLEHLRWYWRWRLHVGSHLNRLTSYQAASEQDREDLHASEQDFLRDVAQAQRDRDAQAHRRKNPISTALQDASMASAGARVEVPVLTQAESIVLAEKATPQPVPALIAELFDQHIHDSHASFYLLGPTSALERKQLIADVAAKQRRGEALNAYERKVAELQKRSPGQLPKISDSDVPDLMSMEDVLTRTTLRMMTATRRESEGHVRARVIFDRS